MIFDVNEENLDLLAVTACPIDFQASTSNDYCMLIDRRVFYEFYGGSSVETCRACWLKWLSKESEDNNE